MNTNSSQPLIANTHDRSFPVAKQSPKWNDQQKERAWKWIQIRFLQVFTIYIWNAKAINPVLDSGICKDEIYILKNASLESTMMSLRDIDDFFDNTPASKPDDLRVTDFGAFSGSGRYLTGPEKMIINKALAHLTDFRVSVAPTIDKIDGIDVISRAVSKMEMFLDFLATEFSATHPHLVDDIRGTKTLIGRNLNNLKISSNNTFTISAGMLMP
jgi:hypothetical protein